MKCLLVLCLIAFVALSMAETNLHPRGCIWVNGRCFEDCPEGTHEFSTGCGQVTPEATCEQPKPVQEEDDTCDYSACHCDPGTVRDKKTNKCVPLEKCTKELQEKNNSNPAN